MNNEKNLDFIDITILDIIKSIGVLHDVDLSQRLHCPRSLLVNRLESLLSQEYVAETSKGYVLTDAGKNKWLPIRNLQTPQTQFVPYEEKAFDWEFPYVPLKGWNDD